MVYKQSKQERNRQYILEVAQKIIHDSGIDGLSIRKLAEACDYSPTTIYNYFANKDAILDGVREMILDRSMAFSAERVPEQASPAVAMYYSGMAYLTFAQQFPNDYLLLFSQQDYEDIRVNPSFVGLKELIQAGLVSGDFHLPPGYDTESLALQHWVMVHGLVMMKLTIVSNPNPVFDRLAAGMIRAYMSQYTDHDLNDLPDMFSQGDQISEPNSNQGE